MNNKIILMEYTTLHLCSTNEVEQWYIRHNRHFIVVPDVPLLYFINKIIIMFVNNVV